MDISNFEKPTSLHYFDLNNQGEQKFFWYVFNKSTKTYWKFGIEETNIRTPNGIIENVKINRERNDEQYYYLIIHKKDLVFWLGRNDDGYTYDKIKQYHKSKFDRQYILDNFEYVKDEGGKMRSNLKGMAGCVIFIVLFGGGTLLMGYGANFGFFGFLVAALLVVFVIGSFSNR